MPASVPEKPLIGATVAGKQKGRPKSAWFARGGGRVDQPSVPSTCLSSPDSYISIMMSEPPMNSPFTYSCGIVGQLLYSLMPWRISSSSSTLTVTTLLGSTPQALGIWIARPEKPHMGKLALPFMESGMSLDLVGVWMRCWVSLMGILLERGLRAVAAGADSEIIHPIAGFQNPAPARATRN